MVALSPHHLIISSLLALVVLLLLLALYTYDPWRRRKRAQSSGIPEVSGARPLFGHLHLLATQVPPHQVLGDLADKYGPIFTIKLGTRRALIISSWEWVKECLGTHDRNFLTRPSSTAASKYLCYNDSLFAFTTYGPYWRNMRRISTQELLSNTRLEQLKPVRSSELNTCIGHLFSLCKTGPARVDMSEWFSHLTINVMLQMIAGKRFESYDENDKGSRRFHRGIREFLELMGMFEISDVIPFTKWIDFQGYIRRMKRVAKELDYFLRNWMEEHVKNRSEGKVKVNKRDFMDVLLETLEEHDSSPLEHQTIENVVKGTALNLFLGGTDTTSTVLTWALALVLNHKEVLKKAQNELDVHVGKERWVEESDIKDLTYIVAIVKEALRLYPVVPINLPHVAIEDCYLAGNRYVYKGTTVLVNIWKLHRDPRIWSNPEEFHPERFLTSHAYIDVRGQNFEYIPFGSGRRSCPAISSGMQMSCLALARVLQGFNLATPNDRSIDMSIGPGVTMPKAKPLEVILTQRLPSELYKEKTNDVLNL